ncbi:EscV/YscV/HrcV family type III secretion system export apparatus protein [Verrucomicrobia bacterium LW23]|nr:EscV/YscV/HrcV family type III secretion system export apparatus protein [Verrucomicrobia bacterium LW23]
MSLDLINAWANKFLLSVTRYTDILLAIFVVAVIGLMIMPIPAWLLDLLLAFNLGISGFLLIKSLYIPNVLAFSTFPSLLLFTTLLRLALNITTTRLILLYAHAGDIIYTFGNFAIGGNFVVGTVVFLIITLVQFLVITKGAERVAEVGARFTLDAMPGKQMAIDADLRAGQIDMDTAKKRRGDLEKESQLYGAMDGAMKFVKGDAIAGLIITAINLIAGLCIGIMMKDMPIDKAIKTYTILTIGDGLVSQIPALLVSITAGIIVTRVGSDETQNLGQEIGGQFLGQPKAVVIAGVLLLGIGLIPGFPKLQTFSLAAIVLLVGYALYRAQMVPKTEAKQAMTGFTPTVPQKTPPKKTQGGDEFSITVPLMIDVSPSVQDSIHADVLNEELMKIRRALYIELGVPFPGIHLRFNDSLPAGVYRIHLNEVPISQGMLKGGHVLAREAKETLSIMGIPFVEEKQFLPHTPSLWVPVEHMETLRKANIASLEVAQILTFHLSFILKKYSNEFVGLQETKYLLENMEGQFPEVVREVQRVLPVQKITEVMQRLVQEEISIRNLRTILQSLIEWGQKEKEPVLLCEYVRSSLRRYISYKFSGGQNILTVYIFEQDVEDTIRKAVRQTSAGSYLALDPNTARKLVEAVKKQVGTLRGTQAQRPALLISMDVRRYMRKLIEQDLYELPVLSHQELTEEITIQPLGRIRL